MDDSLQVSIGSDDVIMLKIMGSLTQEQLPALETGIEKAAALIKETSQKLGRKVKVLIDITGFDGVYDVAAVKAMALLAKKDAEFVERTASFGGPDAAKIPGEVAAHLARRDNIRTFSTQEEALQWLTNPV